MGSIWTCGLRLMSTVIRPWAMVPRIASTSPIWGPPVVGLSIMVIPTSASALALVGITIMLNPTTGGPHIGDVLAILGTIAQGLMTVLIRRNPHVQMLPMAWVAVILSVIVAYPLASQIWELSARDYLVAAGFGLGPMTLG